MPLFLSASTLAQYTSTGDLWPTRKAGRHGAGIWAFDSGAYTANAPQTLNRERHPWHLDPDDYGGLVTRVIDEIGTPPRFVAIQDWPCEPNVRAVTGLPISVHQELTIDSFQYLTAQFPHVPWIPILQGWAPTEYLAHMDAYERRGIDLSAAATVGLGSTCRRGSAQPIVDVVQAVQEQALARYGMPLPLHGFGVSIPALRRIGHLLASCDSMAGLLAARYERIRLPGCTHRSAWCNNCHRWALQWREKVLDALQAPDQPLAAAA